MDHPLETRMNSSPTTETPPARIVALDVARGVALLAMAAYHLAWDLEFFGYAPAGMTSVGGWKIFARSIASSFLFLVGFSLVLAHARGIRWRPMMKRLAMVIGAAAAISIATYFALPQGFIFFGILHQIALASVLGLAFLRVPVAMIALAAAFVAAAPLFLRAPVFDHPALWWIGLAPVNPRSNDYVPLFPWFAAVLAGMAAAKIAARLDVLDRLGRLRMGAWHRPTAFFGRHSLSFYLIHQPVLIGLVWLATQIFPPPERSLQEGFQRACNTQCTEVKDTPFCERYCSCMLTSLETEALLGEVYSGGADSALNLRLQAIAGVCTGEAELPALEGGPP